MKKFLVIGNPIEHSLSPKLHNFWLKQNKIDAHYGKKLLEVSELKEFCQRIKKKEFTGINVTVPFKREIIPFLDKLTDEAQFSQSVNTILSEDDETIGHNTDIVGFELALKYSNFDVKNKNILVLGAGGVVSSVILALNKMHANSIFISNRTKEKTLWLKKKFSKTEIVEWGEIPKNIDIFVNATSLGLNKNDSLPINFNKIGKNKIFYDLIYNPRETNFLKEAKKHKNKISNGKMMFVFQAQQSFFTWHNILPNIDEELLKFLYD